MIFVDRFSAQLRSAFYRPTSLYNSILLFCLLLGILFIFVIPPFQKPDETTHFYKAISVASGNLICQKQPNGVFRDLIPKYLADFPTNMFAMHIASSPQNVFPRSLYLTTLMQGSFDRSPVNEPTSCSLPFVLYLLLGVVLFLPVHFGFNPLFIFYLGRITNFVISFLLFYYAFRIAPKRTKLLPLFILSLPIVLLQISSFSKDALHLSAGIVAFSFLLRFLDEKKIGIKEVALFLLSTAVMVWARPQYLLFVFLPLLIPFQKLKKMNKNAKVMSAIFIVSVLASILLALSLEIYSAKAVSLGQTHPDSFVYPELQVHFLENHPFAFPGIINATLEKNSNFYFQSAVDVLGWLEFRLPWYVSLLYFGLAVYIFLKIRSDLPPLSFFQFLIIGGIIAGTFVGIFLSFYLYATPVGSATILAPQGRYFILLVPYIFWLLAAFAQQFRQKFIAIFFVLILLAAVYTIAFRYYSPNQHFYRDVNALPAVDRADSLVIANSYQEVAPVDPQKKIVGYSFFVFKRDEPTTKPYEFRILDQNCNKLLRSTVIDVSNLKYDDWNDITFPVISDTSAVCLTLQPYSIQVPAPEALQFALQSNKKLLAIPLYVY